MKIENDTQTTALPSPHSFRWKPCRSGLINLYKFDYEEFHYHDGKMLVRGNNGAGKTRFLALQLPFLLDGDISSQRVEPDGSLSKKMEWNLLMDKYQDRVGYTWIEFARLDEEGKESFITLGCGLHATEGRGLTGRWFFVTHKRVGKDLFLLNEARQPLRKDRLEQTLGSPVYTTVANYRKAVDEALFGLGTQRYEAMLNLLIQLRQPQLSKEFHEERFSSALSDALAPLPSSVISDIAEAFRGLDRERQEVGQYERAVEAMDSFLADYRQYARIAARKKAEDVRLSHSAYENDLRASRELEQAKEALEQQQTENANSLEQTKTDLISIQAKLQTLKDSPEMKGALEIERLSTNLSDAQADAEMRQEDVDQAAHRTLTAEKHLQDAQNKEQDHAKNYDRQRKTILQTTLKLETSKVLEQLLGPHETPPPLSLSNDWEVEWQERKRDADSIKLKWDQTETCRQKWTNMRTRRGDLESEQLTAQERLMEIQNKASEVFKILKEDITSWHGSLAELSLPPIDVFFSDSESWSDKTSEINSVERAAQSALGILREQLVKEETKLQETLDQLEIENQELKARQKELASGVHFPPQSSVNRDFKSRADRKGAAFWELFDFAEDLAPTERAGLEGALEASGLLDAWVTPEGDLLSEGTLDAAVVATATEYPPSNSHLGTKLTVLEASTMKVSRETAERILRLIGSESGAGSCWVSVDGTYALGPLQGGWKKSAAQHIGASARETTRLKLLQEVEDKLADVFILQKESQQRLQSIEHRRRTATTEISSIPDSSPYRTELNRIAAQALQIEDIHRKLLDAVSAENEARALFDEQKRHLDSLARELNLDHWKSAPSELLQLLEDIRVQMKFLLNTTEIWRSHAQIAARAAETVQESKESQSKILKLHLEAQRKVEAAKSALETLQKTAGKAAIEIQKMFAEVQDQEKKLSTHRDNLLVNAQRLAGDIGSLSGQFNEKQIQIQEKTKARQIRIDLFKEFAGTSLLPTAYPELTETENPQEWSNTRAVDVARRIESLSGDDSKIQDWDRLQKGMHGRVSSLEQHLLELDLTPSLTQQNDVLIVDVTFQNQIHSIESLRQRFDSEILSRRQILNSREQEILENHLIDEISVQLHHHLYRAENWLIDVNKELNERPTSSGMRLRFKWALREDAPQNASTVRRLLLRSGETWSNDDRTFIARFLQEQIQEVRLSEQSGTWDENLTKAFDYRRWHVFSIERQQNGQWKKLTKRTHGTGSGGEKAIALTMPQFAAAAAHYRGARPECPRLILLDEAFVGVDKEMRSKSLGLLQVFDLDLIMTSESEWGCYPTLPGIAIFQLVSGEGIDAVHVRRFTWNGRKRMETPQTPPVLFVSETTEAKIVQTDFFSIPISEEEGVE